MTADFSSRTVPVGAGRIHLVEAGRGPLVLLLHGFPECWFSWRHQLVALAEAGFRAVAMTGRGYGRSSKPADVAAYRVTELVADCVGVVHALGESTAVLTAHDWGAQVAWCAAWLRPDVFTAVASLSVPFGGRGLTGLPGRDRRPSDVGRDIAGPDLTFYMNYIAEPGRAEREIEPDIRGWLRDGYYNQSADPPLPAELHGVDLGKLDGDAAAELLRGTAACIEPGGRWRDRFLTAPEVLPGWLDEDVLNVYTRELEYSGFTGPLNWYRCLDLDWELMAPLAGTPVTVPAVYIAGERDPVTIWSRESIELMETDVPDLRGIHIFPDCGHWVGEERPDETNEALVAFVESVS